MEGTKGKVSGKWLVKKYTPTLPETNISHLPGSYSKKETPSSSDHALSGANFLKEGKQSSNQAISTPEIALDWCTCRWGGPVMP